MGEYPEAFIFFGKINKSALKAARTLAKERAESALWN